MAFCLYILNITATLVNEARGVWSETFIDGQGWVPVNDIEPASIPGRPLPPRVQRTAKMIADEKEAEIIRIEKWKVEEMVLLYYIIIYLIKNLFIGKTSALQE